MELKLNRNSMILAVYLVATPLYAKSFNEIASSLDKHPGVVQIEKMSEAMKEAASYKGSWGDPRFKLAAKNFPKDSLKDDETPMTGIEFGISQKIGLSTKYANIERAYESQAHALNLSSQDFKMNLVKSLWDIVILNRRIKSEVKILNENYNWIKKILKISKKLYANGKTSQQAILDISIRKSELETQLSNMRFSLKQLNERLKYISESKSFDYNSVPWKLISAKSKKKLDFKELALKKKLESKKYEMTAAKQNFLPDVTFGLGYTKRSNVDNRGDFVSASLSFPLPFSSKKYSGYGKAVRESYSAQKALEDYKNSKNRDVEILNFEISKINSELKILKNKTIKFALNSRKITAKSYSLGNSTYLELLQSELKLQNILMKKVMLEAKRDMKIVTLRYKLGESLYE